MTSWPKRIDNVPKVIFSLLNQSVKPDSIELNLSIEEFPNKEKDLPEELQSIVENELCNVNWVEKNTKSFKKFIPVLQKYYGESYFILTVDDDRLYGSDYIKSMVNEIQDNDSFSCFQHCVIGLGMIYNASIFNKELWEELPQEIIETGVDDAYIEAYLKHKHAKMKSNNRYILDMIKPYNETEPLHDFYLQNNRVKIAEELSKQLWN